MKQQENKQFISPFDLRQYIVHQSIGRTVNDKSKEVIVATQKQNILESLLLGLKLTHLEAEKHFGCSKISTRCSELIDEGWPIQKRWITVETPFGPKDVMQYSLYGFNEI